MADSLLRRMLGRTTPEAPPEPEGPTHLGPVMDDAVARSRANQRPRGEDADYDLVRDHFDLAHYLLQATALVEQADADPVELFLEEGAGARHSPDVNFSMGAYLRRHPRVRTGSERSPYLEWLKRGRAAGQVADPAPGLREMSDVLGRPRQELVEMLAEGRDDLTERLRHGTLGEMFAKAVEVEPQIGAAWPRTAHPTMLPFGSPTVTGMAAALHDAHRQADFRRARVVIMVNRPRWGGGRRAEGHIATALAEHLGPEEVVVVYTDIGGPGVAGRFPAGVREVRLADSVEAAHVGREDARRVLVELLKSLCADVVVNINATLFYEALVDHGPVVAASQRVFHVMFCNDQGPRGNWGGHPLKNFHRHVDGAVGVIADSHYLRDWLVDFFSLSDEYVDKLSVFSAPVDPGIAVAHRPAVVATRRPQVCWAGRFDRQKLIGVVIEVARRLPEADFRMWGEGVAQQREWGELPANVTLEGAYAHFQELDLGDADVWLYTSGWDGVPSQLLEVAMTGVPIVGSLVGGTSEVLDPALTWPVTDVHDPEPYVAAIRDVLRDPDAARRRALDLRTTLVAERSERAYAEHAVRLLLGEDAR